MSRTALAVPPPTDQRTPIPTPRAPEEPVLRATPGLSADGRRWVLRSDENTVTAVTTAGTVAEAHVSEPDERVVVELWSGSPDLPPELTADLVARAFALPAIRPRRPVLVCLPRRDAALLEAAHRYVRAAWTRAAGTTCLIEGRIGATSAPAPERAG